MSLIKKNNIGTWHTMEYHIFQCIYIVLFNKINSLIFVKSNEDIGGSQDTV